MKLYQQFASKAFTVTLVLSLSGLNALHAQAPAPNRLHEGKARAMQTMALMHARQIGMALFIFDSDYGKMPSEKTIQEFSDKVGEGVKVGADSANDCFYQLMLAGHVEDPSIFSPNRNDQAKPGEDGIKKIQHCFYSYIVGSTSNDSGQPVLVAPLVKGKTTFDSKALGGKAVVLFTDMSAKLIDIDEQGRVMVDGKDLFDPAQPYWNGKKPDIKWAE